MAVGGEPVEPTFDHLLEFGRSFVQKMEVIEDEHVRFMRAFNRGDQQVDGPLRRKDAVLLQSLGQLGAKLWKLLLARRDEIAEERGQIAVPFVQRIPAHGCRSRLGEVQQQRRFPVTGWRAHQCDAAFDRPRQKVDQALPTNDRRPANGQSGLGGIGHLQGRETLYMVIRFLGHFAPVWRVCCSSMKDRRNLNDSVLQYRGKDFSITGGA